MLVAASTACFPRLSLPDVFQKLVDLEFSNVEIVMDEQGKFLKPSQIVSDLERAVNTCRNTKRLDVCSYQVHIDATGDEHYRQFTAICKLGKAAKVMSITIPSAELGTPFNEEVEHLRRLVAIAAVEGVRVSMKSQIGRLSQDPDTVVVLCDNVKGLGLTLDPSHYICGPHAGASYPQILKYVYHVQLRDSSKEEMQVRIGKGEVEYGRLVTQLGKEGYKRALSVDFAEMEGVDHMAEMRKMRLLLESLV